MRHHREPASHAQPDLYFAMDVSSAPAPRRRFPMLTRLRTRAVAALRSLRRRRGGALIDETERSRWAQERAVLLEDNTVARTEAHMLTQALRAWEALLRDAVFHRVILNRADELAELLTERLNASLAEVEGLAEVEITELRLPTAPAHAPTVTLLRYDGPLLSEWRIRWAPPSSQGGGAITLRGRKFGVSFQLVMAVGSIGFDGVVRCSCTDLNSLGKKNKNRVAKKMDDAIIMSSGARGAAAARQGCAGCGIS